MSRTIISAVVGVVITVLTVIAFYVSKVSFEERTRTAADEQLQRAYQVVQRLNTLQGIDVANKAERLGSRPEFLDALTATNLKPADREGRVNLGFQSFLNEEAQDQRRPERPDILALVNDKGEVVAMYKTPFFANMWLAKNPGKNPLLAPTTLPAVNQVLRRRMVISDLWNDGAGGVKKIGVAPVIDPARVTEDAAADRDPSIVGAIVIAYAITAKEAEKDRELLGTEVAYYDNKKVVASSFTRPGGREEDTAKAAQVGTLLAQGQLVVSSNRQRVTVDGVDYYASAVEMPRKSTKPLDAGYPAMTAGVAVLAPVSGNGGAATSKGLFVLLLGGGALAMSLLGIFLVHRRLIAQVDQIEQGVNDIINGNVDRTFRPVGPELDGLANGLNVMLARLLGRPEPGEEEFDEDGNPIIPGRVEFEESEGAPATDPDLAALAQESEPDYYKRVYTEYLAARKAAGAPDEVSFENFIAKLKVNEGKLKAQYQCRAVRFRVVTKDGKVSLKPVPIYA